MSTIIDPASTSIAAYHSLPEEGILERVQKAIEASGERGMTCDEIADITGIEYRTVTPRIVQLEKRGLAYRAGDTRNGKTGRKQLLIRSSDHLMTCPIIRKTRKDGFMRGLMYAASVMIESENLADAKTKLKKAIIKRASKA